MKPEAFSLGGDGSTSLERLLEELEVGLLEEGGGGSNGIRRIGNDNVEFSLLVLKELESISNVNGYSRIGEGGGHVREVELGHSGNGFVDVAQDGRLDGRVLEDLSEDSTISTTDDENGNGVRVRSERQMSDHFCNIRKVISPLRSLDETRNVTRLTLVGELISFDALNDRVEDENVSVMRSREDEYILVL